jgi:hypothetical protein
LLHHDEALAETSLLHLQNLRENFSTVPRRAVSASTPSFRARFTHAYRRSPTHPEGRRNRPSPGSPHLASSSSTYW